MTPELDKYYQDRFSMFSSEGWKDLVEDVKEMRKSADTISGIEDTRKLGFRQGELAIMDWLLSIQQVSEDAYEGLQNETA